MNAIETLIDCPKCKAIGTVKIIDRHGLKKISTTVKKCTQCKYQPDIREISHQNYKP